MPIIMGDGIFVNWGDILKNFANLLVKRRNIILIVTLALTVVCLVLSGFVSVNKDMAKYLPDTSSMHIGMDIMDREFPEIEEDIGIRVMSEGLSQGDKNRLLSQLKRIPYVDHVEYDDSIDYNRDPYALFRIVTEYEYGSPEEKSIEEVLERDFGEYNIIYVNDDTSADGLDPFYLAMAVAILIGVLFLMSNSWVEPFIFLVTIGIAVVLNNGTNLVLGEISNVTSSIAAMLQLILSMDYSIILTNRYRQERLLGHEKHEAMVMAIKNSAGSVVSSSLTTVVGLLALVFMNYKIGMDLGIVMGKGVFISMLCVFTALPSLLIFFDKIIEKTKKRSLEVPMGPVATFSKRFRFVMLGVFIAAFISFGILQSNTDISFAMAKPDPIKRIFPKENMLVMVYENQDEDRVLALTDVLEEDKNVSRVLGYPNLLGKSYKPKELLDALKDMGNDLGSEVGDGTDLDPTMVDLIYYHYFDGELRPMTMSALLEFISDDVIHNDTFSGDIDEDILENSDRLHRFSDKNELVTPKSIAGLAEDFEMDADTIKKLLLFYYSKNGGVSAGTMTLQNFVGYVLDSVATNPDYSSMFDAETKDSLSKLRNLTDPGTITTPVGYQRAAELLGLESGAAKSLYIYQKSKDQAYVPENMSVPEFVSFLQNDVFNDPDLSKEIDANSKKDIDTLAKYTDKANITAPKSAREIADALDMKESQINTILAIKDAPDVSAKTLTLSEFFKFMDREILMDPNFSDSFDVSTKSQLRTTSELVQSSASGTALYPSQMAGLFYMSENMATQIYLSYYMDKDPTFTVLMANPGPNTQNELMGIAGAKTMTIPEFLNVLNRSMNDPQNAGSSSGADAAQMAMVGRLVEASVRGESFTPAQISELLGMDLDTATMIYRLYFHKNQAQKSISLRDFVNYLVTEMYMEPVLGKGLDKSTLEDIKKLKNIMDASADERKLTPGGMASIMGMETDKVRTLYVFKDGNRGKINEWKLSPEQLVSFILANRGDIGSSVNDGDMADLERLQRMMRESTARRALAPEEMGSLLDMEASDVRQLYLLNISEKGNTSGWRLSLQKLVDFMNRDVISDPDYAKLIDNEKRESLLATKDLIDAVVSGAAYGPEDAHRILKALSGDMDRNMVDVLYFYHGSKDRENIGTLTIEEMFNYVNDVFFNDPMFADFVEEEDRQQIRDAKETIEEGIDSLKSDKYSRLVIYSSYPEESFETSEFVANLRSYGAVFNGDYHLVGTIAMSNEMENTFGDELRLITLLTSIAMFIIILISFRNVVIPIVLVLLVQCSVYLTITVVGIQGYSINFLALLIVECILMGATIDYGILFSNYFVNARKTMDLREALAAAYKGSIHTIMTSGLIIVLVTGIVGNAMEDPTVAQIIKTISTGTLCAILMIVFVLPGVLASLDWLINSKKKKKETDVTP